MAKKSKKKKKQLKRHHFVNQPNQSQPVEAADKPAEVTNTSSSTVTDTKSNQTSKKSKLQSSKSQLKDDELNEKTVLMQSDAKTTLIVGSSIIAILIVLWVLFEHSGLGDQVYRLIHIT